MEGDLDRLISRIIENKYIDKFSLRLENNGDTYKFDYQMEKEESFVLASVTKLFTTACILFFHERERLNIEDPIGRYLGNKIKGLNTIGGLDYSRDIKIKNLLYQNAGFPGSKDEGLPMSRRIEKEGESLEEIISQARAKESLNIPGGQSSYYTSINFLLLGKIIEAISGLNLDKAYEEFIFKGLKMDSTYLVTKEKNSPNGFYKNKEIDISSRLEKAWSAGGAVSTAKDLMTFTKSFFQGKFFSKTLIKSSSYYSLQKAYGPIKYGLGHMKLETNNTYFLGHNGISGAFAFYNPSKDIYMTGTFNQFADQTLTVKLCEEIDKVFNK